MNFFTRGAEWLRHFFPSSKAARISVGQLDQVVSPVFDFASWGQFAKNGKVTFVQPAVGATGAGDLLDAAGEGMVNCIVAAAAEVDAAAGPSRVRLAVEHTVSGTFFPIGENLDMSGLNVNELTWLPSGRYIQIPDPYGLRVLYQGGNGTSQITARVLYFTAPLGTTPFSS